MKKYPKAEILNYLEEHSQYCALLKDRFISEEKYLHSLASAQQGFTYLKIPTDTLKIFENRTNLIVCLDNADGENQNHALLSYIAHKKKDVPIPEELSKQCPKKIASLIDNTSNRKYLNEYPKELRTLSLSIEMFLTINQCLIGARAEGLLPNFLSDLERMTFTSIDEVLKKIPAIYLNYLTSESFMKVVKKISLGLRATKENLEEEHKNIELYALRMKEQLQELYLEATDGLKSIVDIDVEKGSEINVITQKVSNLFSRLDRLFLGNIYHLRDYEKRKQEIAQLLRQEEELRYHIENRNQSRRKKIAEIFDDYMFFAKFGPLSKEEDKIFTKMLIQQFEEFYRQKSPDLELFGKFEKKGLLGVGLDFDGIKQAYEGFIKDVIIPQHVGRCLLDMVNYLPPNDEESARVRNDLANLKVFALEGKKVLSLTKSVRKYPAAIVNLVEKYRKCITILVYDIRGSSYMGIRLHNAVKEQKIKYKFAKEMAEIVKKYDGFLLKDTGDGGLVWFSENSGSLYKHLYTESFTGRGMQLRHSIFSGAEFDLIPALDSAKRAVLCARDMVKRAEEFIKANFMHYREWFADVAERTLELDGITYALLPPEFKSLFRIGIGIASGEPDKDVILAANSYGDPDMVGPIIADAHYYSMERQPGRSVVICDLPTVTNLVLNVENFEFPVAADEFNEYLLQLENLRNGDRGYRLSDHKIEVTPKGIHILEELDKRKALGNLETEEVNVDENGLLYNEKNKRIKFIYEVLNI